MRQPTDRPRLTSFLRRLGNEATRPGRVYLTGGATAVWIGWRTSTIDVDLKLEGGADDLLSAMPRLKEELQINVELACPSDFIPELPEWRERSQFISRERLIECYHYDFYAQALAKIERAHALDLVDVQAMIDRNLIDGRMAGRLFTEIEPMLHRYPAIDPPSFRRRVEEILGGTGSV